MGAISQVADDLIVTIEHQLARIDEKLRAVRVEKQAEWESAHIVARLDTWTATRLGQLTSELDKQRDSLLERARQDLTESLIRHDIQSEFDPGLECSHILNTAVHFLGSLVYANPFSLLKKLAYFPFVDQFTREIRLPDAPRDPAQAALTVPSPIITPVRILVLVKLNRLFVHLNRIETDPNDGRTRCTTLFKMFNFKWDELSSLSAERDEIGGVYKNLIAIDRSPLTSDCDSSVPNSSRRGCIVCLFARSESGRHTLRMYDDRLRLVANNCFDFGVKLVASIIETDEIVCWRNDCNQIMLFNTKLQLMDIIGQDSDPERPFYFPSTLLSTNLIDMSQSFVLIYTADEETQTQSVHVIERASGRAQGCIQFGFNSFPNTIKLDSNSNILVRTCDGPAAASLLRYYSHTGVILTQLGGDVNNPNRFARFNRIDLIRPGGNNHGYDELMCFCKEDRNILFF